MQTAPPRNNFRRRRSSRPQVRLQLSSKVGDPLLNRRARYKILWGGRGGQKSWGIARALVTIAHTGLFPAGSTKPRRLLIGCFRELQNSIKDSVHRLLKEQIELLGLAAHFDITEKSIRSRNSGSEFIFKGIKANTAATMKSLEGVDIAWVEEAHLVSEESWQLLIPTIRREGSEIWISFNPDQESDPTYKRFVLNPPPGAIVIKVGWQDNPWFPDVLEAERSYLMELDYEAYMHVWEGECRSISDAMIFKPMGTKNKEGHNVGNYVVECFDPPEGVQFLPGLDFGYAEDPAAGVRCWTTDHKVEGRFWQELWIDYEAYGHGIEIDDLPSWLDSIPEIRNWSMGCDNSRPESVSYIKRFGYSRAYSAEKWPGSVEDGISHLKAFRCIHIHQRCTHLIQEARLYKWKVDKQTGDILPIIVDKHNHCWDAIRYALSKYIKRRGVLAQWAKLGR